MPPLRPGPIRPCRPSTTLHPRLHTALSNARRRFFRVRRTHHVHAPPTAGATSPALATYLLASAIEDGDTAVATVGATNSRLVAIITTLSRGRPACSCRCGRKRRPDFTEGIRTGDQS